MAYFALWTQQTFAVSLVMMDQASAGGPFHPEDIQYEGRGFEDYAINTVRTTSN